MTIEVTVIERGSQAFDTLAAYLADPDTYKVSIDIRADGIAIKRNESVWTPTYGITSPRAGGEPDDWKCQQFGYHMLATRHREADCRAKGDRN